MNGSIYLLRANPALTTNVKLVCDSSYNLYLESYSANQELSDKKYKKFQISDQSFISERIARFYYELPADAAFFVKNDTDSDSIQTNVDNQYDDTYMSGGRFVEDTRYQEEFQYNTTLKIDPKKLPKHFIVFRVDGTGHMNLTASNINNEIFYTMKVASYFDLSKNTAIGRLFTKNYIDDDKIPDSPFELNLKKYEFSKWNGYDYRTGGTVSKSFFMDEYFMNQTTHYELETFITDGFKKNEVVCANYLNVSFLYDDTVAGIFSPATTYKSADYKFIQYYIDDGYYTAEDIVYSTVLTTNDTFNVTKPIPYRKVWAVNRYFGFYMNDLHKVNQFSPFIGSQFKNDSNIVLENNVFMDTISNTSIDPTVLGFNDQTPIYFKIDNTFYLVEKTPAGEYKLVSDKTFDTLPITDYIARAQKAIKIDFHDTFLETQFTFFDGAQIFANNVEKSIFQNSKGIYLIKIYDKFYRFHQGNNGHMVLLTDEYIKCDNVLLQRKLGIGDYENISNTVQTKDDKIPYFEIYRCEFTDIADFDFDRDVTDYSRIEYDKMNDVSFLRPFLHEKDIKDRTLPSDNYTERNYTLNFYQTLNPLGTNTAYSTYPPSGNVFILPVASEYQATGDIYMLDRLTNLTSIWAINQSSNKWGIKSSISSNSYPYKLNNSIEVGGLFNMAPNPWTAITNPGDFSLDWFYTPGKPIYWDNTSAFGFPHYSSSTTNVVVPGSPFPPGFTQIYDPITFRSLNIDLAFTFRSLFGHPDETILNQFYKIDTEYYNDPDSKFDWFSWVLGTNSKVTNNATTGENIILQVPKIAYFTESDGVNGPSVFFRGLQAYVEYADVDNTEIPGSYVLSPANDVANYGFAIIFDNKETNDTALHGKMGIDVTLNKVWGNLLIYIYIYTPYNAITNLHHRMRDDVYNEKTIKYYVTDALGNDSVVDTHIPIDVLTLKNMYRILNGTTYAKIAPPHFQAGLKYNIVEKIDGIAINDTGNSVTYNASTACTEFTLSLAAPTQYKHGEFVYLTNFPDNIGGYIDGNYKIAKKIDNFTIVISVKGDYTIAPYNYTTGIINTPTALLASTTVSKQKSVLPFVLRCQFPDKIDLDTTINIVTDDDTSPIKPNNDVKYVKDLYHDLFDSSGIIENVYIDNPISRNLVKIPRDKELTDKEIAAFPKIWRYSAGYEPILKKVELFNANLLHQINPYFSSDTIDKYYTLLVNGEYKLVIEYLDGVAAEDTDNNNIVAGDVVMFNDQNVTNISPLHHKIYDVESVTITSTGPSSCKIALVLNKTYSADIWNVTTNFQVPAPDPIVVQVFKNVIRNSFFDTSLTNFGTVRQIISKYWLGINPLQSSKNVYDVNNKWSMADEHGVSVIKRNVFKSNWDFQFYYRTEINKYKIAL